MRITEAEQQQRRERMLYAAYDLFCEHGIDSVSMEKIALKAQVSPNSLFRYFNGKTQLLEQTQRILWQNLVQRIQEDNCEALKHLEAKTGLDEMRVLLYGFNNLYQNHSKYILFAYDYKAYLIRKHIQLSQSFYELTLQPVRGIFLPALMRGHADGSITTAQPPEEQFLVLWGVMRHLVEQMLVHTHIYEGPSPWDRLFPLVVKTILENLHTP